MGLHHNKLTKAAGVLGLLLASATAAQAVPIQFAGNGHYYEYIPAAVTFDVALGLASASTFNGAQGYLATITSFSESEFVRSLRTGTGKESAFWLGGSDAASEGTWEWITGPETGQVFYENGACTAFCNWAAGEPNDQMGEDALHGYTWWNGANEWNDLDRNATLSYVVEYSLSPVPLPAGFALMLTAIGGLAFARKRRG